MMGVMSRSFWMNAVVEAGDNVGRTQNHPVMKHQVICFRWSSERRCSSVSHDERHLQRLWFEGYHLCLSVSSGFRRRSFRPAGGIKRLRGIHSLRSFPYDSQAVITSERLLPIVGEWFVTHRLLLLCSTWYCPLALKWDSGYSMHRMGLIRKSSCFLQVFFAKQMASRT